MDHPWRRFRQHVGWLVGWAHLPDGLWGFSDPESQIVVLDRRLNQAQRRCTIAHEMEHFGVPRPVDPVLRERLEQQIDQRVARRLIPIRDLGEAMAWAHSAAEVADELWVDVPTLEARIRDLHPTERAYLHKRMEHR